MNSMKHLQAQEEVRAAREDESRRLKLEQETAADMTLLRAILDAEHHAREVESAAEQRRTELESRIQGRKDELLAKVKQETRAAIAADAAAEHSRADAEIAAEQAEAAAHREALRKKYQLAREGYVQRVFDIVTGKRDE
ncbi:MAG: hypothetical protein ACOX7G_03865 [Candidatus Scatomorpha sp.]